MTRFWKAMIAVLVAAALTNLSINLVNLLRESKFYRLFEARGRLTRMFADDLRRRGLTPREEEELNRLMREAELPER
jgi:hypothetical protein